MSIESILREMESKKTKQSALFVIFPGLVELEILKLCFPETKTKRLKKKEIIFHVRISNLDSCWGSSRSYSAAQPDDWWWADCVHVPSPAALGPAWPWCPRRTHPTGTGTSACPGLAKQTPAGTSPASPHSSSLHTHPTNNQVPKYFIQFKWQILFSKNSILLRLVGSDFFASYWFADLQHLRFSFN